MADQVDIKVSEDLIKGIIEAKVQAAISEALSGREQVIERIINGALTEKVDDKGKRSDYSYNNKFTYIQWLCRDLIQKGAEAAIKKWAEEKQPELEKEFLRQLRTQKTTTTLVKACCEGLASATKNSWRFSVVFPEK